MDEEVPKANVVDELVEEVAKSAFLDELAEGPVPESSSEVEDSDEMVNFPDVGANNRKTSDEIARRESPFIEKLVEGLLLSNSVTQLEVMESASASASAGDVSSEHARNEAEVQELSLLQQDMHKLANAIETHQPSNRAAIARDKKMGVILQVLFKQLSSDRGQRLLRCEANIYHKGDVFAAEKSLIHTCRQSTLMGIGPPMARKFHERKNKNLLASLRKTKK